MKTWEVEGPINLDDISTDEIPASSAWNKEDTDALIVTIIKHNLVLRLANKDRGRNPPVNYDTALEELRIGAAIAPQLLQDELDKEMGDK